MALYCPSTGAGVVTRPEWSNRKLSDSFTANFWVINDSIIYSRPEGVADVDAIRRSLELNGEVAKFVTARHGTYIQIEDYAHLGGGIGSAARRQFAATLGDRIELSSLIFCNLSPALAIAIKIGRRLTTSGAQVHDVRHYNDAIRLALDLGGADLSQVNKAPLDLRGCFESADGCLSPVDMRSDESWVVETPEFSNKMVLVNQSILHSVVTGRLDTKHLPLLEQRRELYIAELDDGASLDYIVVDSSGLVGPSRTARSQYMKELVDWHRRRPFKMYISYGANALMSAVLRLAGTLMPFEVGIARDAAHTYQMIRDDSGERSSRDQASETADTTYVVEKKDMDAIMAFIGSVNWGEQGLQRELDLDPEHPFYMVYQSIRLIKEELDEMYVERKAYEAQLLQAQKMETVGTIAAGIAHDFNNILCIITGNADLALMVTPDDGAARPHLDRIHGAAGRAEGVVQQLLAFSRKSIEAREPMNAISVIGDTLQLLRSSIPASVEIRACVPDTPVFILGDATQLNQVLINLVANAAQSMEETGGTIEIVADREYVMRDPAGSMAEQTAGEYLKLTVRDTGPGIEPDIMDRVFDPYFTTKPVGKGSGMGLAVVMGIVRNHGGAINVASEPGKGTTFTLYIPVTEEEPAPAATPPEQAIQGGESILYVEDETALVEMMREMLTSFGYRFQGRESPVEALDLFRSQPEAFDLVITDMTMPEMSGVELSERVRKIRPDIPIIVCTGFSHLIDDEKTMELDIAALVRKPVGMKEFAGILRGVLDDARSRERATH